MKNFPCYTWALNLSFQDDPNWCKIIAVKLPLLDMSPIMTGRYWEREREGGRESGGESQYYNSMLVSLIHQINSYIVCILITSFSPTMYFRADISCSKLPLRWLDIRAKCDGVGGLEISTQSFLDDDLSSIKHLWIQLLCKSGGREKEIITTPLYCI